MITNFDPFRMDRMVYTFRNRCEEAPDLDYPDGLCFLYFNTCGKSGGSQSIQNMLKYIQQSNVTDDATKEVDGYVSAVKAELSLKEGVMTLGERFDHERNEGARETRIDDILRLLEDHGDIPSELTDKLKKIENMEILSVLHKKAAHTHSIADFEQELKAIMKSV